MRYHRRASKTTRIVYAGISIGLIYCGHQKMIVEGPFSALDGEIGRTAIIGFTTGSVGPAALVGSITPVLRPSA